MEKIDDSNMAKPSNATRDDRQGAQPGGGETPSSREPFHATPLENKPDRFRDYRAGTRPGVRELYRLNHTHQTLNFVLAKKQQYSARNRMRMGIWEALELLNTLVDDSDPDTDLPQTEHALQTAEAIRRDGRPDWFVLAGLVHDFGKILWSYGEPQWAVVGDTFPVGCGYSEKIIYCEFFAANPDYVDPRLRTKTGIYEGGAASTGSISPRGTTSTSTRW